VIRRAVAQPGAVAQRRDHGCAGARGVRRETVLCPFTIAGLVDSSLMTASSEWSESHWAIRSRPSSEGSPVGGYHIPIPVGGKGCVFLSDWVLMF
jgi:hypothetical protein